jgi:hypothetical protein
MSEAERNDIVVKAEGIKLRAYSFDIVVVERRDDF